MTNRAQGKGQRARRRRRRGLKWRNGYTSLSYNRSHSTTHQDRHRGFRPCDAMLCILQGVVSDSFSRHLLPPLAAQLTRRGSF